MRTAAARHVSGFATMLLGSAAVLAVLVSMNELTRPPAPEPPDKVHRFTIEDRAPEPPEPEPKRRPDEPVKSVPRAPAPTLTTSLSGLSFDLPQLGAKEVLGTDELLPRSGADDELVMTEESVDTLPEPRRREAPGYPQKARARGIEGRVVLELKVSERGRVERVRVVVAVPEGVFEEAAVAAARTWRFEPATYQGEPVSLWVKQAMPFRLN